MKKPFLIIILFIICSLQFSNAQNTFPSTGSTGIGTTSPTSDLEVFDNTGSKPNNTNAPTKSAVKISRAGTSGSSYNEAAEFRIGHGGPGVWGSQLDLYIDGGSNTSNVPDQQVMTWLYNGTVGIGTTTPGSVLSILNSTPIIQLFDKEQNPQDGSSLGKIAFGSSAEFASVEAIRTGTSYDDVTQLRFSTSYATGAGGDGDNMERMRITPAGNVLINRTTQQNASYKLDVAGSVRANAVTVNTSGADFVFEPSYHLLSLAELEKYLKENHHLPEIASAKEMQTDGLNLGENQTRLLQKIEELTLYTIAADKKTKDEEALITQQQNTLAQQQALLLQLQEQLKAQQKEIDELKKNK